MEQVTRFYDESQVHEAEKQTRVSTGTIPRIKPQGVPVSLNSFLTRPYRIETISWQNTDAIRATISTLDFPFVLRNNIQFLNKLQELAWWAPDIEIEIQINSTKFHYGRLLFAIYPFTTYMHDNFKLAEGASTWPDWYQLSANSQQSIKILVPYRHFYHRVPLYVGTGGADNYYVRFFTLKTYVAAPLLSAMDATPAPVTITIYARCVDPHVTSYCPLEITAQAGENLVSLHNNNEQPSYIATIFKRLLNIVDKLLLRYAEPLDRTLNEIENMCAQSGEQNAELMKLVGIGTTALLPKTTSMVNVPISTAFNTISSLSNDAARYSNALGYSNPVNPAPTNSMQIRQPLFSKINDMPNSVNLGPSQTATVDTTNYNLVNGTSDDVSFVNICGHPSLLYTGKILSTTNVGAKLVSYYLNPQKMVYGDYEFAPVLNSVQPLPFYYIARLFQFWRGSAKLHISFVSSSFHSCRVRLVWNPVGTGNDDTYSTSQRVNMYNVLMDINQQTDYSILIPYDQSREWLRTSFETNALTCSNGFFGLYLETKLTSTMATPQPIYYQIFFSMADDLQLAGPTAGNLTVWGNPDIRMPTLLVSDEELEETENDFNFGRLMAQTGETVQKCEVPSSSAVCLRDTKFVSIMGDNTHTYKLYGESTAFEVTSAKQLANMLTPMEVYSTTTDTSFTGRVIAPFAVMSFLYNDVMWCCMFNQMRTLFRFVRGGFRYAAFIDASIIQSMSWLTLASPLTAYSAAVTDMPYVGNVSPSTMVAGSQYFMSTQVMPADVVIPYFSTTPCVLLATGASAPILTSSAATIAFSNQNSEDLRVMTMGSAADDLMFGTRMGMPRIRIGAYPP